MDGERPLPKAPTPDPEAMRAARVIHQRRIAHLLEYIHLNLGQPLDLNHLGRIAHLSPSHLSVVFRGQVGESVYQHVRRLRLERAAVFLRYSQASVLEIALACGFETHEAFTRAFRAAFRCSPRTFRQRHQIPCDLPAPTSLHYRSGVNPPEFVPTPDLGSTLNVCLVHLPAQRLAFYRRQGCYKQAHWAWPPLLWWAWKRGRLQGHPILYGLTYDDEQITPPQHQRYDAALVVEEGFAGDGVIRAQTIEAGLFAVTTIRGSFADYWRASEAFSCQWLPQSGFALRRLYTLDRYHTPPDLHHPIRLLEAGLREFHVDMYLPIGPGPFERPIPS